MVILGTRLSNTNRAEYSSAALLATIPSISQAHRDDDILGVILRDELIRVESRGLLPHLEEHVCTQVFGDEITDCCNDSIGDYSEEMEASTETSIISVTVNSQWQSCG